MNAAFALCVPPAASLKAPPGVVEQADRLFDNARWAGAKPRLSVIVPTYRYDCSALIAALGASPAAAQIELIVLDDGGGDRALGLKLAAEIANAGCAARMVQAARNRGRAGARNALIAHARASWLLLLDADMLPDEPAFIGAYLRAIDAHPEPALVVGGYSLRQASRDKQFALHRWQAERSECLPAAQRSKEPGRHVFTSNVMAHREILSRFRFDETFSGWGWEDTDWGLRVAAKHPVLHIDNTATHLGLDADVTLIAKYRSSGGNFARVVQHHPEEMAETALHRATRLAKKLPCRRPLATLAEKAALARALPTAVRGRALKALRALVYAETL